MQPYRYYAVLSVSVTIRSQRLGITHSTAYGRNYHRETYVMFYRLPPKKLVQKLELLSR